MNVPDGLHYTKDHEWMKLEGETALVGITDFAQQSLGDITYLELPEVGAELKKSDTFGVVESVKAVSDLFSPVDGKVTEVNADLINAPEGLNEDPYAKGWLLKVTVSGGAADGLMTAADYVKFVEEQG